MTTQRNEPRAVPVRTCIGCRTRRPQAQLVRCAWTAGGPVVDRCAAGRGAWLCSIECFDTAVRRRAFSRAWRRDVSSSSLDTLRIPLESVITNMRDLAAAGHQAGTPSPRKG